jgi:hypothetical protein
MKVSPADMPWFTVVVISVYAVLMAALGMAT